MNVLPKKPILSWLLTVYILLGSCHSVLTQEPKFNHVWGMWGVTIDGGSNDDLAEMVKGGIEYITLAGWQGEYSPSQVNWRIARALRLGAKRVVVPITHSRIKRATALGNIDEIKAFIDSVDSGFFYLDEPKHNGEDVSVIAEIGRYVNEEKPWPSGLYSAEPVVNQRYDASYYGEAYRLMPDYYNKSLEWKKKTYENLERRKPLAPVIGLMYKAGTHEPYVPDSVALRLEIDNALPFCREIWFYARKSSVIDQLTGQPFDLFNPIERWKTLKAVLKSYEGQH